MNRREREREMEDRGFLNISNLCPEIGNKGMQGGSWAVNFLLGAVVTNQLAVFKVTQRHTDMLLH